MIPTYFGFIGLLVGIWLLRRGAPLALLCAMLAFGLFEASAAIILPVLGDSSIPPARLMLGFLLLSMVPRLRDRASLLGEAVIANAALIVFCAYGLVGAFLLPRIFAAEIDLVPMRPLGLRSLFDAFPLAFSAQNVTTAVYLVGTGLTAIAAYVAGRLSDDASILVRTGIGIGIVHAVTGILGVALAGTFWDQIVEFIRNGSYAQVTQLAGNFGRINGFMAEPSAYARFGFVWFAFATELWLRHISPRYTGATALLLAAVLVLSLSSTAYVALAGYAGVLAIRFAGFPRYIRADKILLLSFVGVSGLIVVLAVIAFNESLTQQVGSILERLTVNKSESVSGQQRLFWALQGLDAFRVSWGLGVGAGSFRSSSIVTAILGSMGVIGAVSFLLYFVKLFDFPRRAEDDSAAALRTGIASAAAWTATVSMIPAAIIQNSADPGMEFAALAGLSLALRHPAFAASGAKTRQPGKWATAPAPRPSPPQAARPPAGWRRHSP
jgi:hypothetical protein